MVIARLLADPDYVYDSCDAIDADLRETPFGRSLRARDAGTYQELTADGGDIAVFRSIIEPYFPDADCLFVDDNIGVPGVFVSDMDSTMIGQECIDELADYAGLKPQIAAITERAMQGELDFESALRERVRLLTGLDEAAIGHCLAERIRPVPGARTLVMTLRSLGCHTILVTGGFHHFADPVAAMLGFDHVVGNRLDVAGNRLTGGLIGSIVDSRTKLAVLTDAVAMRGGAARSLATGDGANDIPMLQAATYGIAYRAKPKARAAANGRVEQGDLTAILHLLGIAEQQWVE